MRICAIGDPHGNLKKVKRIPLPGVNLILLTGDLGKASLARKRFLENAKRKEQDLKELEYDAKFSKRLSIEIYNSTFKLLRYLSRFSQIYSITGNVWMSDKGVKKDEKRFGIKLPHLHSDLKKLKKFHLTRNKVKQFEKIKIGFIEYFTDTCWIKEFKEKDKKRIRRAKKQTAKAKKVLERFGRIDVLICHQPPYGILDKTNYPAAPENWKGKHAGSKVILDYIKKYQPKYVFCGHIHEGEGKARIGKTEVYNLGVAGHKIIEL